MIFSNTGVWLYVKFELIYKKYRHHNQPDSTDIRCRPPRSGVVLLLHYRPARCKHCFGFFYIRPLKCRRRSVQVLHVCLFRNPHIHIKTHAIYGFLKPLREHLSGNSIFCLLCFLCPDFVVHLCHGLWLFFRTTRTGQA